VFFIGEKGWNVETRGGMGTPPQLAESTKRKIFVSMRWKKKKAHYAFYRKGVDTF